MTDEYDYSSQDAWLALGFAWLREYTDELLPWFELLPSTEYLPNTWSYQKRVELLNGTETMKHIMFSELVFSKAVPYIDMLGLTEPQVRDAFALLQSRAFGTDLSAMGGYMYGLFACAIDFGNHNLSVDSSVEVYVDMSKDIVKYINNMVVAKSNIKTKLTEIDFSAVYWYIDQDIMNATEIFNNYGKHNSAEMFSLFGFIVDNVDDYYTFFVNVPFDDINYDVKLQYFGQVWNLPYLYGDIVTKNPGIDYGNMLQLNGHNMLEIDADMLRRLRLTYLPAKYFDSFTISSILNHLEYNYLRNIIDPLIIKAIHGVCDDLLMKYPTSYNEDEIELTRIEMEKNDIINKLKLNRNRDLNKSAKLGNLLWEVNTVAIVLRYRMKEKLFLMECFNEFEYDNFPCVDTEEDCSAWSDEKECDVNPMWMHVYCAKSCNTCYRQTLSFKKNYFYKTQE